MVAYEDRTITDESGITLTMHTAQQADRPGAMPLHRHRFCELVLVAQGGCEFFYYGERMFLLPGDLMLVEAEQPHACRLKAEGRLYVCHFEPWAWSRQQPPRRPVCGAGCAICTHSTRMRP